MATINATGYRDGQPFTITAKIADTEIARRAQVAAARRAAQARISLSVFLGRFTAEEYTGIKQAAAQQLAAGNGQIDLWIETARADGWVNTGDAIAQAAKAAFVAGGLLTQDRADIIFA